MEILTLMTNTNTEDAFIQHADAIVCGGGPTGLLTAIMLAQQQQQQHITGHAKNNQTSSSSSITTNNNNTTPRFPNIQVYDRLSPPIPNPDDTSIWDTNIAKFYLIGLGGRGQLALQYFNLWYEVVLPRCISVIGRRDWTPSSPIEGTETIKPIRNNITTQVLPRDKLVSVLYQYIQQHYPHQITLHSNVEVQPIDFHYTNTSNSWVKDDEDDEEEDNVLLSSSSEPRHVDTTALVRISTCTSTSRKHTNTASDSENEIDNDNADMTCDTNVQYVSTPLLIAADGTVRTIANTISSFDKEQIQHVPRYNIIGRIRARRRAMFVKRYVDDNQRVYKTIPLKYPKDWRCDLNYSVRTKRFNLEALPANSKGDYCGVLLFRSTDPMAKANTDPKELRHLFDTTMPQFSRLIDNTTLADVAKKPVSYLPTFRYVGPRLHEGSSTILLGDCAHTVKPYFGLGANSALEDVKLLSEYLTKYNTSVGQAIQEYSKFRTIESKALVRISRDLDRPGRLGFITFILPIILDSIFHKFAPKLFMPNVITMLQRENYTFQQLARRKRLDRFAQASIVGVGLSLVAFAASTLVRITSKFLRLRPVQVWSLFVLIAAILSRLKSMSKTATVEK